MGRKEEKTYQIIWCPDAEDSFDNITFYIAQDSLYYSIKVGNELIEVIDSLVKNPFEYPECLDLPTKNHIYRKAVYAGTYKIIFKIVKDEIWVLDVFHGKRNPRRLKKLRRVKP
jgi:plasmid stabilization system protein ParE